jgi:N-acetylmuramoyl-L-alanine amidase
MTQFLIYLLKAGAWLVPFYLLYLLVFRRFSFYTLNRVYLLLALAISFVMPVTNYTITEKKAIQISRQEYAPPTTIVDEEPATLAPIATVSTAVNKNIGIIEILFFLYFAGVAWMAVRLFKNLFSLYRIIRISKKEKSGNTWLVYTPEQIGHASFFRHILLNANGYNHADHGIVVAHEKIHYMRGHSFDILLCELVKMIHWFNPFVFLYKKSLRELHEFEADHLVAVDKKNYAVSLLQVAVKKDHQFVSPFSRHPLKTRISRLFKPQTHRMKKLLFLLVLPVTVLAMIAFRNINRKTVPVFVNAPMVVLVDAGHGGAQPGAQAAGVFEKTLTLAIATEIKKQAEAAGMKVIMTRTSDTDIPVMDRVEAIKSANPDIAISIHINSDPSATKNGIECYAGANNHPAFAATSSKAGNHLLQSLAGIKGLAINNQLQSRNTGIAVLKMPACPSVLIEYGYISNASDLAYITQPGNQEELAKQTVNGLLRYAADRAAVEKKAAENDLSAVTEIVPLEAKVIRLHLFSPEGVLMVDGKEIDRSLLAGINPAQVKNFRYFEADNDIAIKKYGTRAKNGLLQLSTKNGKGFYSFTDDAEKEKWMEVARAHRRMNTVEKYDRFSYTNIEGVDEEVVIIAGGKTSNKNPLNAIIWNQKGKSFDQIKYVVDGAELTEAAFRQTVNQLPVNGYEVVGVVGRDAVVGRNAVVGRDAVVGRRPTTGAKPWVCVEIKRLDVGQPSTSKPQPAQGVSTWSWDALFPAKKKDGC